MNWTFKLAFLALLFSCTNSEKSDPLDTLLSSGPYAAVSDSIRKFPKRDDLYFRRAVLLNKNNLPEPALIDFRTAWSLDKQERYALGIGTILLDKHSDSTILFLKEALNTLPESIFLQLILARAYDDINKTNEAISAVDKLLAVVPTQVNALMLKSDLLEKKGDVPGMIAALEQARRILPQNLEVANRLAYQYAETKDSRAILLADTLIMYDSLKLHAEPFYVKGNYYSNINDKTRAIQLFDETIRRDHRFLNAYIEKGKILLDQKKTADALKTFGLANTVNPAFPDAWFWIAKCQELTGNLEDAKLNYEKAYGLDKSFTEAKEARDRLGK